MQKQEHKKKILRKKEGFKRLNLLFSSILSLLLLASSSWGQKKDLPLTPLVKLKLSKKSKSLVKPSIKKVNFSYFSKTHNRKSFEKDSLSLFLKNLKTKKLIQVQLRETKNNSSLFEQVFILDWKQGSFPWVIYIPDPGILTLKKSTPSSLHERDKETGEIFSKKRNPKNFSLLSFIRRILNEKEKPHLYFIHFSSEKRKGNSLEKIQIYSSKEKMKKELKRQTASLQMHFYMKNQKYKIEKNEIHFLSKEEREKKKEKGQALKRRAFQSYKNKDFKQAEHLFQKSLLYDLEEKKSHFHYGLSLYRNKKFKEALVELALAKKEVKKKSRQEAEINYYIALILYELGKKQTTLRLFKSITQIKHKELSSIASFYQGLLLYSNKKWSQALDSFVQASQTSKDPKILQQSKAYIKKTQYLLFIQKKSQKKLEFRGSLGWLFDSDLLSSIDVQEVNNKIQKTKLPKSPGERFLLLGKASYEIMKKNQKRIRLEVDSTYLYSFQDKHSFYDPFSLSLSLPFSWRGKKKREKNPSPSLKESKVLSKHRWEIGPHFEKIFMDLNQDGKRENILMSYGGKTRLFKAHKKRWQALYNVHLFLQNKKIGEQEGSNTKDIKAFLNTEHFFFSQKSPHQFLFLDLGWTSYFSKNPIKRYHKLHFQTGYQKDFKLFLPFFWNFHFNLSSLTFPDWKSLHSRLSNEREKSKTRQDLQFHCSTGLKFPLTPWMSLEGRVGFLNHSSSLFLYSYDNKSTLIYLTLLL